MATVMLCQGVWVAPSPSSVDKAVKAKAQHSLSIAQWKASVPFFGGGFVPVALVTQRSRLVLHITLDDKQDMMPLFKRCNALIAKARLNGGIVVHGFGEDGLKDCLVFVLAYFISLGQKYKKAKAYVDERLGFQAPMNAVWSHNLTKFEESAVGTGEAAKALRNANAHVFGESASVWVERKDGGSGATFFFNKETQESVWERPVDFDGPALNPEVDTGDYFQGKSLARERS